MSEFSLFMRQSYFGEGKTHAESSVLSYIVVLGDSVQGLWPR